MCNARGIGGGGPIGRRVVGDGCRPSAVGPSRKEGDSPPIATVVVRRRRQPFTIVIDYSYPSGHLARTTPYGFFIQFPLDFPHSREYFFPLIINRIFVRSSCGIQYFRRTFGPIGYPKRFSFIALFSFRSSTHPVRSANAVYRRRRRHRNLRLFTYRPKCLPPQLPLLLAAHIRHCPLV